MISLRFLFTKLQYLIKEGQEIKCRRRDFNKSCFLRLFGAFLTFSWLMFHEVKRIAAWNSREVAVTVIVHDNINTPQLDLNSYLTN